MQTFTGMQYLKIDIANAFGLDKLSWNDRLAWFDQHEHELQTLVKDAKEPATFTAGVHAYGKAKNGEAVGYMCGLDATASGLQILAALSGCERSARACNLVDTGKREDAYASTYQHVCKKLGANSLGIDAKSVKKSLMTHLYGSRAVPESTFGKGTRALDAFYESVHELVPGANMLNEDLRNMWNPTATEHVWTLPDGFEVVVKVLDREDHVVQFFGTEVVVSEYVNRPVEKGLSLGANIVHSVDGMIVREMGRRCMFDPAKVRNALRVLDPNQTRGCSTVRDKDLDLLRILALEESTGLLSLIVLDYLDSSNAGLLHQRQEIRLKALINSLPTRPFDLLCIHDCFRFHGGNGNDVRKTYNTIMAEIAASTLGQSIAREITGKPLNLTKLSTTLPLQILDAEYALS